MSTVYDKIGKTYDATRKADPIITDILKKYLKPQKNGRYLDIGCGSGNYTTALFNAGISIEGADISQTMLTHARAKHPHIIWHQADARALPFADNTYHGITCTLATHHFKDTRTAFKEIYRVMDKGSLVIFTMTPQQMQYYWLNHYFPHTIKESADLFLSYTDFHAQLQNVGFTNITQEPFFVNKQTQDHFLYSGKHQPEIYLNKNVRDGISSFQLASNQLEVTNGLKQLENDIRSGKIHDIIKQHENDLGDCLFIACDK